MAKVKRKVANNWKDLARPVEVDRRSGRDRRSGEDRRKVDIPVKVDRRSGVDRRSNTDRRQCPLS